MFPSLLRYIKKVVPIWAFPEGMRGRLYNFHLSLSDLAKNVLIKTKETQAKVSLL